MHLGEKKVSHNNGIQGQLISKKRSPICRIDIDGSWEAQKGFIWSDKSSKENHDFCKPCKHGYQIQTMAISPPKINILENFGR